MRPMMILRVHCAISIVFTELRLYFSKYFNQKLIFIASGVQFWFSQPYRFVSSIDIDLASYSVMNMLNTDDGKAASMNSVLTLIDD